MYADLWLWAYIEQDGLPNVWVELVSFIVGPWWPGCWITPEVSFEQVRFPKEYSLSP